MGDGFSRAYGETLSSNSILARGNGVIGEMTAPSDEDVALVPMGVGLPGEGLLIPTDDIRKDDLSDVLGLGVGLLN